MSYPFSLVLHTHLPMVVNHGRWPHGTDWLNEATFECYLPLPDAAHRLVADGLSPKWTINISPVLAEQLASPEFQKELSFYYENVRRACLESREHFKKEGQGQIVGLTYFWEEFYEGMWELHRRIGGGIPGNCADPPRGGHRRPPPRGPRATGRPPRSSGPPPTPTPATSAGLRGASGFRSAHTGPATSGRRPLDPSAGVNAACVPASRSCWPPT